VPNFIKNNQQPRKGQAKTKTGDQSQKKAHAKASLHSI
jgi:hypothetical protein